MKLKARCPEIKPSDRACYGDFNYSDRSSICLAAVNSGAIKARGGHLIINIIEP